MARAPLDPGWEVGTYSICHPNVRAKFPVGEYSVDVDVRDKKPVIRSAFLVTDANGEGVQRVLCFDNYHFSDKEPLELPGPYIQYRTMTFQKYAWKYEQESPIERIRVEYSVYQMGEKPESILPMSWNWFIQTRARLAAATTPTADTQER